MCVSKLGRQSLAGTLCLALLNTKNWDFQGQRFGRSQWSISVLTPFGQAQRETNITTLITTGWVAGSKVDFTAGAGGGGQNSPPWTITNPLFELFWGL